MTHADGCVDPCARPLALCAWEIIIATGIVERRIERSKAAIKKRAPARKLSWKHRVWFDAAILRVGKRTPIGRYGY